MRWDANAQIGINFTSKAMFLFLMVLLILLPFVAQKKLDASQNIDPPSQGILRVEIYWPDDMNVDVDLWVKGPVGDAVGYSNLGGPLWNLLRDDLGAESDVSYKNMEVAFTRGLWDGEYIVNVHLFSMKGEVTYGNFHYNAATYPVPVRVVVSYKENQAAPSQDLFFANVKLEVPSQELTVFRFMVKDNKVLMGTLNNLQKKIRAHEEGNP